MCTVQCEYVNIKEKRLPSKSAVVLGPDSLLCTWTCILYNVQCTYTSCKLKRILHFCGWTFRGSSVNGSTFPPFLNLNLQKTLTIDTIKSFQYHFKKEAPHSNEQSINFAHKKMTQSHAINRLHSYDVWFKFLITINHWIPVVKLSIYCHDGL